MMPRNPRGHTPDSIFHVIIGDAMQALQTRHAAGHVGPEKLGQSPCETATLQQLAEWAARGCGIRWQELLSGSRGGPFTRAKKILIKAAKERGYTLSDVAEYLGCTPGALRQLEETG